MLHAELHGKLAADTHDVERREDILTSTVFGVLFNTEAWQVLIDWFERCRPVGHVTPWTAVPSDVQYWFWPRLDNAEPDVVIRIGNVLMIVEAKFHSGKSGKDAVDSPPQELVDVKDQLVREWRACCAQAATWRYPEELQEAIESCTLSLVYLVKRSRLARERLTVSESLKQEPTARMYVLTWEDLDEALATVHGRRWADEMRSYLLRKRLTAFRGFGRTVRSGSQAPAWHYSLKKARDIKNAFSARPLPAVRMLAQWRNAPGARSPGSRWSRIVDASTLVDLRRLAERQPNFPKGKQ